MTTSLSNPIGQNSQSKNQAPGASVREPVFWRVEGSLVNLTAVRPVGFFAWNSQSFLERWGRRGAMAVLALARPLLYIANRKFATRLLHTVLRGVSRDRLDLLGEEFFEYSLKPRLKAPGIALLNQAIASGSDIILVSQGLDHIMRPLAKHLGVKRIIANRLDFRDGQATGRLLDPVIRPRGLFARFTGGQPDGRVEREKLVSVLGFEKNPALLDQAIQPADRPDGKVRKPVVLFDSGANRTPLRVRETLAGKHILLIGATGFIGKVWLASLLKDLPDIGRIYLLVRRNETVDRRRALSTRVGRIAGIRRLVRTIRRRFCGFSARANRSGRRRRKQAGPGPRYGGEATPDPRARRHHQQFRIDRFQSGLARCAGDQRARDRVHPRLSSRVRSCRRYCIFPLAMWWDSATDG